MSQFISRAELAEKYGVSMAYMAYITNYTDFPQEYRNVIPSKPRALAYYRAEAEAYMDKWLAQRKEKSEAVAASQKPRKPRSQKDVIFLEVCTEYKLDEKTLKTRIRQEQVGAFLDSMRDLDAYRERLVKYAKLLSQPSRISFRSFVNRSTKTASLIKTCRALYPLPETSVTGLWYPAELDAWLESSVHKLLTFQFDANFTVTGGVALALTQLETRDLFRTKVDQIYADNVRLFPVIQYVVTNGVRLI